MGQPKVQTQSNKTTHAHMTKKSKQWRASVPQYRTTLPCRWPEKRGGFGKMENTQGDIRRNIVLEDELLTEIEGTELEGIETNLAEVVQQPRCVR